MLRAEKDTQPGPGQLPWSTLVFVRVVPDGIYSFLSVAEGIPFSYVVMFKQNGGPPAPTQLLWGFRESFDRTPLHTALHVIEQNLGIKLTEPSRVKEVDRLIGTRRLDGEPESHWKYLFCVDISETERRQINPGHHHNGLRPYSIMTNDFYNLLAQGNLYEPHRVRLQSAKLISDDKLRMAG